MSRPRPGPLNWQTAIVDRTGRPTPEFMRYFRELLDNTDTLFDTNQTKQDADDDLTALSDLTGTGIAVRDAPDSWLLRSIIAGSGVTVTNGDGVAGNPTISASGTGSAVLPIVDGSVPAVFLQDPDGNLIYGVI